MKYQTLTVPNIALPAVRGFAHPLEVENGQLRRNDWLFFLSKYHRLLGLVMLVWWSSLWDLWLNTLNGSRGIYDILENQSVHPTVRYTNSLMRLQNALKCITFNIVKNHRTNWQHLTLMKLTFGLLMKSRDLLYENHFKEHKIEYIYQTCLFNKDQIRFLRTVSKYLFCENN